ncbi:hypothetical protein [Streptomyces sp. NPDC098781]|uniref:hypothetical protein n=1 Tax=Streptomyces sp. NPDC098781 TaxID=3366097 RepID=UPI003829DA28
MELVQRKGIPVTEGELADAMAVGVASGLTDTACPAVHDLYLELREAVRRQLVSNGRYGVRILDAYETDPDVWRSRLVRTLTCSGAVTDEEIVAAARAVLRAEQRTGCIAVFADGVQKVPVGDDAAQHNTVGP